MMTNHPHSELFDLTYSSFGKPEIKDTIIRVPVREIGIYKGFPGHDDMGGYYEQCSLIFAGVSTSIRMIAIASPSGTGWEKESVVYDGPFPTNLEAMLIQLSGPTYDPPGWIEWDIYASSIHIET